MLKSILSGIASALRAIGRAVFGIAMVPLRLVDRLLVGGDGGSPQEIPEVRRYEDGEPKDAADSYAFYLELANRIMTWAADSIVADAPASLPPRLPIALREWLPGVTRAECEVLINADEKAISAHIQRAFPLPGVRLVQRLAPLLEWPREPSSNLNEGSPSFVSYAGGHGPVA
jgi:hypothetical protein